ncbi:thioredoxin family protein [Pelagibacterium xiamenense]|uniref:thioredoxin family protein n=1 Tax=Pelagibacterium xiamenense TaxID=2901140 RepID=UPI001E498CE1|nr:thioredoxin family protein [Pelagibacterium xiamenense]MCD7060268.1 thioredoxin family protein [Pelagibacterium xiamenense]
MAVMPEQPKLDIAAPEFALADVMGENGAVIVFICNHCPYVKAVVGRLVAAADTLRAEGIGFAAICSNDAASHPEDSFENMGRFAREHGLTFPYLHDESQAVARAYEAVCTPDFYGLDGAGTIKYRGRLDEGRKDAPSPGAKAELVEAMRMIAATGEAPGEQVPSMGCSIKWKAA